MGARVAATDAGPPVRRARTVPWTGHTTPDRLRRTAAVLVLGCLVTAVVSVFSATARTEAVQDGRTRIAALTSDAATLYQVLADADAMATSGYVAGGREPASVRARYDADIERAAQRLVHAAEQLSDNDRAAAPIAIITTSLPVFTGRIETARTYNRQGLPLGQSYLSSASTLMRSTILPAAAELRSLQTAELTAVYARGAAIPFAVLLLGLGLLAALVDLSLRERARTHRVLSPGLVAATVAVLGALLWWAVAEVIVAGGLDGARRHGQAATALDDSRTVVTQARSNESLVLVARGGGSADQTFGALFDRLVGPDGHGGLLAAAEAQGAELAGVRAAALEWQQAHRRVRELDDGGRYREAVAWAIGTEPGSSGALFQDLDDLLSAAVAGERAAFADDIERAAVASNPLVVGPAALLVVAAAGVAVGVGRRVGEYR